MGKKNKELEFISKKLVLDMIDRDIRIGNPAWTAGLSMLYRKVSETRGYTVGEILEMNGAGSNRDASNKES